MSPNTIIPSSVPSTPSVDFQGPRLVRSNEFKPKSNFVVVDNSIDLDDFDPLIRLAANASLETDESIGTSTEHEHPPDNFKVIIDDSIPALSPDATTYLLLDKHLQLIARPGSNYSKEADTLSNYTLSIAFDKEDNQNVVPFLAPSVDYNTTRANPVKLVVYEDRT